MFGLVARLIGGMVTPLIDQISASSARLLRKLALFAVAGVALVVVLIALTIAFDLWIASMKGPIVGALAVAGLYLVVAIAAVVLATRPVRPKTRPAAKRSGTGRSEDGKRGAEREAEDSRASAAAGLASQVDAFTAPLLNILQGLGLRKEQLAVLAGSSLAKQIGPVPLVGLAIVGGFLIGRMWKGWKGLFSTDLVASLLSSELLSGLFSAGRNAQREEPDDQDV